MLLAALARVNLKFITNGASANETTCAAILFQQVNANLLKVFSREFCDLNQQSSEVNEYSHL